MLILTHYLPTQTHFTKILWVHLEVRWNRHKFRLLMRSYFRWLLVRISRNRYFPTENISIFLICWCFNNVFYVDTRPVQGLVATARLSTFHGKSDKEVRGLHHFVCENNLSPPRTRYSVVLYRIWKVKTGQLLLIPCYTAKLSKTCKRKQGTDHFSTICTAESYLRALFDV